jgi:hypothetical protein
MKVGAWVLVGSVRCDHVGRTPVWGIGPQEVVYHKLPDVSVSTALGV